MTPWREIVRLSLAGTIGAIAWVVIAAGGMPVNPLALIQPGDDGPSVAAIREDFPDAELLDSVGLDGQQFYAIARQPFDLDATAEHLDRPEYRLRRPLYSVAAWALHPTGGGEGLIWALATVNVAALLGGGIASGALSTALGGRTWPALFFPLLPGSYMSLHTSVADATALALALGALAFAARKRSVPAVAFGVAAVLSKETMLVVLAGWALAHRTRRDVAPLVVSGGVLSMWMLFLRMSLPPHDSPDGGEIVAPFTGFPNAIRFWLEGESRLGMFATCAAVTIAIAVSTRVRLAHPLSWVLALNLLFMTVMSWNVLALDFGATRSTYPLLASALVVAASLEARVAQRRDGPFEQGAAGMAGPESALGAVSNR